jgi:hypothetical protein
MECFELSVNGQRQYAAGVRGGLLHGHMLCAYLIPPGEQSPKLFAHVSFGGTDRDTGDHLNWDMCHLKVGDEVLVRLVDQDAPDEPKRRPRDLAEDEARERKMYEKLKAKFEAAATT